MESDVRTVALQRPRSFLLSGSAGYVGKSLLTRISAEIDKNVVALYRKSTPNITGKAYPFSSDMSSNELIETALRSVDCVVHLAWDGTLRTTKSLQSSNLKVLDNLITAMEKEGTRRLVFLSPHGAQPNCGNFFLEEKYRAELRILNSQIPEKVIIRTHLVFGGDPKIDRLRMSSKRLMGIPGFYPVPKFKEKLALTPITELVEVLCDAMKSPMQNELCLFKDVCGQAQLTIQEIFKILVEKHYSGGKLAIPEIFSKWIIMFLERTGGELPIDMLLDIEKYPPLNANSAQPKLSQIQMKKYFLEASSI